MPLFNALAKQEDVLEMVDAATSMDLLEEAKQAIEVLSKKMNSVRYI